MNFSLWWEKKKKNAPFHYWKYVFKYSFFPSRILKWNKIDRRIQQSATMLFFRNVLLKNGWPTPKSVYSILGPNGLKLLTRLGLGLSYLNQHKFNHNFRECVNPLCSFRLQVESVSHFFLHCHYFTDTVLEKCALMNYNQLMKIF